MVDLPPFLFSEALQNNYLPNEMELHIMLDNKGNHWRRCREIPLS